MNTENGQAAKNEERKPPEVTVRPTQSKAGHHHFIIEVDGDPIASSHLLDKYSSETAAMGVGNKLVETIQADARAVGYQEGYQIGRDHGQTAGERAGKREGFVHGKAEGVQETTAELSASHNAYVAEVKELHDNALLNARVEARGQGESAGWTKGAWWGIWVGLFVFGSVGFVLGHYGVLTRLIHG